MVFYHSFSHFVSVQTLPHALFGPACCISNAFSVLNILTHFTTLLPFGSLYGFKLISRLKHAIGCMLLDAFYG